ncbi:DUF364 domain-containing protein [Sorangium sp. So ce321]|uniref:Rossmann-like domain-containing protein n=1 Tax=Sorangium sp. So ce321 TaxID=3133300 RepID=UPI003F611779
MRSPRDSIIFERLRAQAIERSRGMSAEIFALRGLWRVDYRYRPNEHERDLAYSMVYAQTLWQGCAYSAYGDAPVDDALLGADTRHIVTDHWPTSIAVLDAVYANFERRPLRTYQFSGNAHEKTVERARIIVEEVCDLLGDPAGKRVLNVGVMGNFFPHLLKRGVRVIGSDFDPALIERGLGGVKVCDGQHTNELIHACDLVLATGMTLTTATLDSILQGVKEAGKKLVLFAATGSHFGETYCKEIGVDCVISEYQPQYMFQGTSRIDVFRAAS